MNNEDKIVNLVEGLAMSMNEMLTKMDKRLDNMDKRLDNVKTDLQTVKNIVTRMEHDHGEKLKALFDGYKANYEAICQYDPRLTQLERAVEHLNIQVGYLQGLR